MANPVFPAQLRCKNLLLRRLRTGPSYNFMHKKARTTDPKNRVSAPGRE